jgi:hypothetical protein
MLQNPPGGLNPFFHPESVLLSVRSKDVSSSG